MRPAAPFAVASQHRVKNSNALLIPAIRSSRRASFVFPCFKNYLLCLLVDSDPRWLTRQHPLCGTDGLGRVEDRKTPSGIHHKSERQAFYGHRSTGLNSTVWLFAAGYRNRDVFKIRVLEAFGL